MTRTSALLPILSAGLAPFAQAQVVNGDFETGVFAPWVISNTDRGMSVSTSVATFDIDGGGPLPPSLCARVMAGQTASNSGMQGVTIHQAANLPQGAVTLRFDWGVHALISTPVSAGMFELMVDGVPVASGSAPTLTSGQRAYGALSATVTFEEGGTHDVGVRITRSITAGAEVWQHVDNFTATPTCDPDVNCDGSVNGFDIEATEQAINGDYSNFCQTSADLNGDGAENGFDIEAEEQRVNGAPC